MKSAWYSSLNGCVTGSRSRRAQIAELNGKMPATRAAQAWGFKSAASLRQHISACEWHHVGKYANAVDYYDVQAWIDELSDFDDLRGLAKSLTQRGRELVLVRAVRGIIASNLKPNRFNCSNRSHRKHRFFRIGELERMHSVRFDSSAPSHLAGAEIEQYVARLRAQQVEVKRAAFAKKIQSNLTPLPVLRHETRRKRLAYLFLKYGNFRAKKITRALSGQSLSLENFLAVKQEINES